MPAKSIVGQIIGISMIILFILIGLIGLVLPLIPGIIFLILAAYLAAKMFPGVDSCLRRNATIDVYLTKSNQFSRLSNADKIKICLLSSCQILFQSIRCTVEFVKKQFSK